MRKRIGVVSIAPNVRDHRGLPFERFYDSFGKNTGNYMFTQAMFRQLDADMEHVGFNYSPEKANMNLDHIVIPAANWLNERANWDWLTDIIEQTEIPVTTIGIGLQSDTLDIANVRVSDSAIRFARCVSKKSPLISARGDFTRDWLNSIGVDNAITTGCPSLYMCVPQRKRRLEEADIVLQSTRYDFSESLLGSGDINRRLFEISGKLNTCMIFQSEVEELEYLVYKDSAERIKLPRAEQMPALYGVGSMNSLLDYLEKKGKVFFDLDSWANFLGGTRGVIGTRLHGSIIALNSGVPAILVPHDSRTGELVKFAKIPTLDKSCIRSDMTRKDLESLLASADTDGYYEARRKNAKVYTGFLSECRLHVKSDGFLH